MDIVNSLAIRRGHRTEHNKTPSSCPHLYLNIFSSISSLQVASTVSASMISLPQRRSPTIARFTEPTMAFPSPECIALDQALAEEHAVGDWETWRHRAASSRSIHCTTEVRIRGCASLAVLVSPSTRLMLAT